MIEMCSSEQREKKEPKKKMYQLWSGDETTIYRPQTLQMRDELEQRSGIF